MRFFVFVILQICHAQKPCTLNPMRINLSVTKKLHCKSIRLQVHMKCSIWDRAREDGEFPLLIKDQWDYHGRFKVYFRMSVAQFDALLAILEPHIKRKTTHFCELRVIFTVLCDAWRSGWTWQSPFWISAFAFTVALYCQNTFQNACHRC